MLSGLRRLLRRGFERRPEGRYRQREGRDLELGRQRVDDQQLHEHLRQEALELPSAFRLPDERLEPLRQRLEAIAGSGDDSASAAGRGHGAGKDTIVRLGGRPSRRPRELTRAGSYRAALDRCAPSAARGREGFRASA